MTIYFEQSLSFLHWLEDVLHWPLIGLHLFVVRDGVGNIWTLDIFWYLEVQFRGAFKIVHGTKNGEVDFVARFAEWEVSPSCIIIDSKRLGFVEGLFLCQLCSYGSYVFCVRKQNT